MMDSVTALGLAAGALTTLSFVPQVVKAWKTRSTHDVSLAMFIMLSAGIALWTVYGFLIRSLPVILTNIVTLLLTLTMIVFKIKEK